MVFSHCLHIQIYLNTLKSKQTLNYMGFSIISKIIFYNYYLRLGAMCNLINKIKNQTIDDSYIARVSCFTAFRQYMQLTMVVETVILPCHSIHLGFLFLLRQRIHGDSIWFGAIKSSYFPFHFFLLQLNLRTTP